VILAGIATLSAGLLYLLEAPTRSILSRTGEGWRPDDLTDVSEGLARPSNA
jgi:hypothetical protein